MSLSKFRLPDLREAGERSRWRTLLHQGSRIAENDRSEEITEKRIRRKNPDAARDRGHNCTDCGKWCASAAGLAAHRRWTFYFLRPGRTRPDLQYIYIYIGLSYHICGKLEVAFKASPSSQHQHCTDEAQKAETVLSAVRYSSLV